MADDIWPEEVGVPTWLETPATSVGVTLPTVTRPQFLPLNELTWENFERLCLRYVRGMASRDKHNTESICMQDSPHLSATRSINARNLVN